LLIQCLEKSKTFDRHLKCTAVFEEQLERCPCAPQCPSDCPCESYDCDAIENSETSVLILYSYDFASDQHVLDRDGSFRVLDEFNYERDTQVYKSCSVVMAGKMWVFGGTGVFSKQLSSVAQCHLKTEGKMPFDLDNGAANTVEGFNGVQTTILCFHNSSPYKSCYSFDGTNFETASSSNHPHRYTSLGKMNEGVVAISGYTYQDSSVEVELFVKVIGTISLLFLKKNTFIFIRRPLIKIYSTFLVVIIVIVKQ